MGWKRESTRTDAYVEVELDDFSERALLQGLIDAKWITEAEAEAISLRAGAKDGRDVIKSGVVTDDIERAQYYASHGNKQEALIYLERALGGDFLGRLA